MIDFKADGRIWAEKGHHTQPGQQNVPALGSAWHNECSGVRTEYSVLAWERGHLARS